MAKTPLAAIRESHRQARGLVERVGIKRTRKILERAELDLHARLREAVAGPGKESFTYAQNRAALAQVRAVLVPLKQGMKGELVGAASTAAEKATESAAAQLRASDARFRGVGQQPLSLDEGRMFEEADAGARASILRRLTSFGTPEGEEGAGAERAGPGILDRYGEQVVGYFEEELQAGLVSRAPWDEIRANLVEKSPFLRDAPAHWSERIVRTELAGAYNRGSFEAAREADDQLGDVVKILAATFDDRTAADSYAVHGQIRLVEQAFQTWQGFVQHPPARPNDREVVITHRIAWPLPAELAWRSDDEISARWKAEGRKQAHPPRPKMTTVPLDRFGRG